MENQALIQMATQVRRDIVRMVHGAASGHPGGSLGCADLLTLLYFEEMQLNPDQFDMNGTDEDLFFLSNGHISPVWYSVLSRRGYFPVEELATFRKLNTRLQGHPATEEGLPGIRIASGSLGQGLSAAIGAAQVRECTLPPRDRPSGRRDGCCPAWRRREAQWGFQELDKAPKRSSPHRASRIPPATTNQNSCFDY